MKSLIVNSNNYDTEISKLQKKYPKIKLLESSFTGLDESYPVAFRVPDGIFYANVTEKRLVDVITGHADDLIIQSARVFSVEMKKYISEPIYRKLVKDFLDILEDLSDFSSPYLVMEMNQFIKNENLVETEIINPLKMALIKTIKGPSVAVLLEALGKDESVRRIKDYLRNYRYRF